MSLYRNLLLCMLIPSLLLAACAGGRGKAASLDSWQPREGLSRLIVTHDGFERELLVQVPRGYDPTLRYPLVFGFHGAMRDSGDWPNWLSELAGQHAFIGIYPDGVQHSWEAVVDGRRVNDAGFVSGLIAWADTVLAVDDFRRYAVGFSAGGFLVNHLACEIKGLAGIAAISGTFHQNPQFAPVSPPRRIFLVHGANDNLIPYAGGMNDHGLSYEPAESSALRWSRALGCDQSPESSSLSERVTQIRYAPCRGAGEVVLLKVDAGHHPQEVVDGLFTMIWDFWQSGW